MKFIKKYILITLCLSTTVIANNLAIRVGSVELVDQAGGFTYVQFDVSWDNSWRTSTADPYNYDAIWVFVKYKVQGDPLWRHASLSTTNTEHSVTNNNSVAAEFKVGLTGGTGKGVFIQRAADGSGSIDWDKVKLKWLYGDDGVAADANVTVRVFAIEMVYIPQGSFSVGDRTTTITDIAGHLHRADDPSVPFLISSESEFWLGHNLPANMASNEGFGQYNYLTEDAWKDDFGYGSQKLLSTAYPKGYNAFYIMKYEITQGQYADFLNCLTRTQQNNRTQTDLSIGITSVTNRYVMSATATISSRSSIKCDAVIPSSDPITFYCDFNGDGTLGDGKDIPCNFIHFLDGSGYADWAGLRPFTELEFEKACRGSNEEPWSKTPVTNEYSWGNIFRHLSSYLPLFDPGTPNELPNNPSTGTNGNSNNRETISYAFGPFRSGIFATNNSDRVIAGASYYGVMEMTGNLWEVLIGIGTQYGRNFTGTHGDGYLYDNGEHNIFDWPGYILSPGGSGTLRHTFGIGYRGGGINWETRNLRISHREFANVPPPYRSFDDGTRLARTAP